jgi:hypothetical protein
MKKTLKLFLRKFYQTLIAWEQVPVRYQVNCTMKIFITVDTIFNNPDPPSSKWLYPDLHDTGTNNRFKEKITGTVARTGPENMADSDTDSRCHKLPVTDLTDQCAKE